MIGNIFTIVKKWIITPILIVIVTISATVVGIETWTMLTREETIKECPRKEFKDTKKCANDKFAEKEINEFESIMNSNKFKKTYQDKYYITFIKEGRVIFKFQTILIAKYEDNKITEIPTIGVKGL